ncbi:hypothetical protein BG004_004344 [Podila humilis]|nr:hypothetical protein BG004_004344 [Podila humilis]
MSEPTTKRAAVAKPQKKKAEPASALAPATSLTTTDETDKNDEPLIDIPTPKKKKERHVKTDADIAAKQERKRLRKEAELAKRIAKQHQKKINSLVAPVGASPSATKVNPTTATPNPTSTSTSTATLTSAATTTTTTTQKVPKWKQFLKNTSETDNAEALKDTSYKVKGDDGSGDESESEGEGEEGGAANIQTESKSTSKSKSQIDNTNSNDQKRKVDDSTVQTKNKNKKRKQDDVALANLNSSSPGLEYLVEWKRSRDSWKFQKLRQVWLINHMYNDKEIPDSHWGIFLEYIRDLKGAARATAIQEAQQIVDAPDEEEKSEDNDEQMNDATGDDDDDSITAGEEAMMSEEEKAEAAAAKATKIEAKRAAEVKSARALEVLRLLA